VNDRERIEEIARLMGATIVCQLPNYGGVSGAWFQGEFHRRRMEELRLQAAEKQDAASKAKEDNIP